jgi:uncharacterized protein YbjT (DUF2867 family)
MADTKKNVLVFGPTGVIGRVAAIEAHRRGANVSLAMRDTSKVIEGLEEGKDGFPRLKADLSQPSSLKAAVEKSSATAAFVYTIHESEDHMKASFEALKSAGITYIVVISSYGVKGAASDKWHQRSFLQGVHAQTEMALGDIGVAFTALRPGYFNSNLLWPKSGILAGEVDILYPTGVFDFVAPEDIGSVAAALLVKGEATKPIPLCGPQLYSVQEAYEIVGKTLGKEVKVKEVDEEEYHQNSPWYPKPMAESLLNILRESLQPKIAYPKELYDEAVENIRIYGEIEPTKLEEWVESHREEFV